MLFCVLSIYIPWYEIEFYFYFSIFDQENPEALGLILYSDEVEPCNPIGASKTTHKLLNVYLSFTDISKSQRFVKFDYGKF